MPSTTVPIKTQAKPKKPGPSLHLEHSPSFNEEHTHEWDQFQKQMTPFLTSFSEMNHSLNEASQKIALAPDVFWKATTDLWQDNLKLWTDTMSACTTGSPAPPTVIKPEKRDRRFRHPTWDENPVFNAIKQSYLLMNRWGQEIVSEIEDLEDTQLKKAQFAFKQMMDAISPSNFAWTNPDVIERTIQTQGLNLVEGTTKLLDDWKNNHGLLRIQNTDTEAFELGKNLAMSEGKVVYQNELMQLIQYTPKTNKVFQVPLLIIPAWINKFYIFDLQEHNSFIKWAVGQGHTVFMISWVNPDARYADKSFSDYMLEGPLEAIKNIQKITGSKQVNAIGHCLGGILLTTLAAYLGKDADKYLKSITLLATLIDFSQAGDLLIFTDPKMVEALEHQLDTLGYVDGKTMASTFNILRANDLIWSSYINNYLLSKDLPAFDLLFWNSDSTHLPAAMYRFYMENMFQKNLLQKPGGINLLGRPIDLRTIKTPAFILGTIEDHIAPWKSTFEAMNLFKGPAQYVLSESGHIAGVVNPVSKEKYGYWTSKQNEKNPEAWLQNANKYAQSWWHEWDQWVQDFAGERIGAKERIPDHALEDAPGSYVKVRA